MAQSSRLADPALIAVSLLLTAAAQPHLFASETLVSLDTATQYYPWYAYLGQSLRAGYIPGWNPATFSGTPFAANPLSGWTYLPAMLVFSLLPLASAIKLYLLIHPLLAACGAYTLSRVLGLAWPGALLGAVAYANTSFLQVQNASSSPFASVYAWVPFALLGVELAVRSTHWRHRLAWWGFSAVSMSQIVAAWPGQGSYYAAMLVGGFIAYRTLLASACGTSRGPLRRTSDFVVHCAGVFLLAVLLDAAALLPRFEFNSLSNLAGGYTGADARVGGLHPKDWVLPATPGFWYAGLSVLALAISAPLVAGRRLPGAFAYFGLASLLALLISGSVETPLHWLLYHLLPGLARLHPHAPERILTVAYLGPALLAGVCLEALRRRGWRMPGVRPNARCGAIASGVLILAVTADLALGGAKARSDVLLHDPTNGADKLARIDAASYFQSDGAADFLQHQLAEGPSRFVGYAPYLLGQPWPYSTRFMDPATAALEVNNRALLLGLQDAQGYDAAHVGRYDAYLARLNGRTQNYHDAEVFPTGLSSPLLDLLNVRYLIVPPQSHRDPGDTTALRRFPPTVYADANVSILENPAALPRAWIVHAASELSAADALEAIDSGRVKARDVALLEETPPLLAAPADASMDRADVTTDTADRTVIATFTQAAGLVVLSEVYYPAWHAYVDNRSVHLYVADGALRAVPVPAGAHTLELRFESSTLTVGIAVSLGTIVILTTLLLVGFFSGFRSGRR